MSSKRRMAAYDIGFGGTVEQDAQLCRAAPGNWELFSTYLQRDWQRTLDPAAPAKAVAVALRLGRRVPAWAGEWLTPGLVAVVDGHDIRRALGLIKGKGQNTHAEDRQLRQVYEYAGLCMRVLINSGNKPNNAAEHTSAQLANMYRYPLNAGTILKLWKKGRLPEPDLTVINAP